MQTEVNKSVKVINLICKLIFDFVILICAIEAIVGFRIITHLCGFPDWPDYIFGFLIGFTWWAGVDVIHKHFDIQRYI